MISPGDKLTSFVTGATIALVLSMLAMPFSFAITKTSEKRQVTLTGMLEDQGDAKRWNLLLVPALEELRARHPDKDIQLNFTTFPYAQARVQMLKALTNQTPIDLISVESNLAWRVCSEWSSGQSYRQGHCLGEGGRVVSIKLGGRFIPRQCLRNMGMDRCKRDMVLEGFIE